MKPRSSCAGALAALLVATTGPVPAAARAPRPAPRDVTSARAHFKQGRAYQEAGAWADAIREYEKAFALAPLPELLYNIGQCHRLAGDKPKAIASYQRFLDLAPEHALADEARNHLATLKLKIQVEEAEAAKRRALAEAEAARRRAEEAEAAKRRTAEEVARQLETKRADEARQRRLAKEAEARRLRLKEAARKERERRLAEARRQGKTWRDAGIAALVVGSAALAFTVVSGVVGFAPYDRDLKEWRDHPTDPWSVDLDVAVRREKQWQATMLGLGIGGGALLVTGIVLYRLGVSRRSRALEAVPPVTVTPLAAPGFGGLSLQGRF